MLLDPRNGQILVLSSLLLFGVGSGILATGPEQLVVCLLASLGCQCCWSWLKHLPLNLPSACVTALSLTLLLRVDHSGWLAIAAIVAISAKFLLRYNNKHLFNPANIGIVTVLLVSNATWTSPGQWGQAFWLGAMLAIAGLYVTGQVKRIDLPLLFLVVYAGLLFARAAWLGDPWSIPLLRLGNGALIIFAFFMLSDPKTSPDRFSARVVFASVVAVAAYVMEYHYYVSDALFYALAMACVLRPALELLLPAPVYQWPSPRTTRTTNLSSLQSSAAD